MILDLNGELVFLKEQIKLNEITFRHDLRLTTEFVKT